MLSRKQKGAMSLNPNPLIHSATTTSRARRESLADSEDNCPIDKMEVFDIIRNINDPEHPLTLEQLNVAQLDGIVIDNDNSLIEVEFTPTIPHCSMATLIGLSLRIKLMRSLPRRFKVDVRIAPGTHASEHAVNKQLNDKERVQAAVENSYLLDVVNKCIADSDVAE